MKQHFLGLVVAIGASSALAQSCPPMEYSQYKDQAKSGAGRISLAFAYCRANRAATALLAGPRRDQCDSEMAKIRDALTQARDYKGLRFAMRECQGSYP